MNEIQIKRLIDLLLQSFEESVFAENFAYGLTDEEETEIDLLIKQYKQND